MLLKKGRYYVRKSGDMRTRILQTLHDSGEGGHSGIVATSKRVEAQFYRPGMKTDVLNWVRDAMFAKGTKGIMS